MHSANQCRRNSIRLARSSRQGSPCAWLLVLATATLLQTATQPVNGQELPTSDAGYIDGAIVRNQLRFRFDAAYDNPAPDRAEFFYPKCGCFPGAPGPLKPESSVDYQEIEEYLEYVFLPGISAFVELPIRFIDPVANPNETGLGDVRSGFKYALRDGGDRWLTFQLRGYFPTGDGRQGLGTEHYSIEPGLLYQRNFDGMSVFGEFKTWIPIGSSKQTIGGVEFDYSGVVTRYGIGLGYDLLNIHDSSVGQMCDAHQQSGYASQESSTLYAPGYSPYRGDAASHTQ